jgi:cytoskeletal protein RodZ
MTIPKIGIAALFMLIASLSRAQDRPESRSAQEHPSVAVEKSAERSDLAVATPAKPATSSTASTTSSEVFSNIVIAAGQTNTINSTLDYSAASTVAVTVECTICTTAATSLTASGLVLQAGWTVPGAVSYVVAETKPATAFSYTDAGGALFNVYGTQFRLMLQNKGTQNIAIQQVTLFRHGQ